VPEQSQEFAVEPVPRPHGAEKCSPSIEVATKETCMEGADGPEPDFFFPARQAPTSNQLGEQHHGMDER
jgi:hypothetical protein